MMSNTNTPGFDMESAIQALREGQDLTGKNAFSLPLLNSSLKPSCRASWNSI